MVVVIVLNNVYTLIYYTRNATRLPKDNIKVKYKSDFYPHLMAGTQIGL